MKKKLFVAYISCQDIKFSYKNKYNIINDIVNKQLALEAVHIHTQ